MDMKCEDFFNKVFERSIDAHMDIEIWKNRMKKNEINGAVYNSIKQKYREEESQIKSAMPPYSPDTTVKQYFENISCSNAEWFSKIMIYISNSNIIDYDAELIKRIEGTAGGKTLKKRCKRRKRSKTRKKQILYML